MAAVSSPAAHADNATCNKIAGDEIEIDGLLDDWNHVAKRQFGGTSSDASFALRCGYDDKMLYLSVDVRDDYLWRGKNPKRRSDDHLAVALSGSLGKSSSGSGGAGTLLVFPGNDRQKPRRMWNGKKLPRWVRAEDSLQKRGWSLEVSIPRVRIPGLGRSMAGIKARVEYADADYKAKVETRLAFDGILAFQESVAVYRSFLEAAGLSRKDIRLDQYANVDDTPGAERVLYGGKIVGVLGERYAYMELPVRSARDVTRVSIADLRGDGTKSIVTEYRQFGNGGSRDVVAIWNLVGQGKFERLLAFEVRKQMGDKVLINRWSLVPRKSKRGKKAKRGRDVVIEVAEADARGWDEDNYREAPAVDARAILLPWSDQTSAVYNFEGNSVVGGGPKPASKRKRR